MDQPTSQRRKATTGKNSESSCAAGVPTQEHRQIPRSFQEIIDPRHTVLLIHEMLNAFVSEGGAHERAGRRIDASSIVGPMAVLIAAARRSGVRVAYVKWTNHVDGSTFNVWTGGPPAEPLMTPDLVAISAIEGTWGHEVVEGVGPEPGDWVIKKYRPDAFFGTPLDAFLRWSDTRTIVIAGIGAEVGIVPTLMTASNLGYLRVAVTDCIRPSKPARLEDALRYIADYAVVKSHTEVVDAWNASGV